MPFYIVFLVIDNRIISCTRFVQCGLPLMLKRGIYCTIRNYLINTSLQVSFFLFLLVVVFLVAVTVGSSSGSSSSIVNFVVLIYVSCRREKYNRCPYDNNQRPTGCPDHVYLQRLWSLSQVVYDTTRTQDEPLELTAIPPTYSSFYNGGRQMRNVSTFTLCRRSLFYMTYPIPITMCIIRLESNDRPVHYNNILL